MVYYNETIFYKVYRSVEKNRGVLRKIGGNPFKRGQKNFGIFEKIVTWWELITCEVGDGVNGTF